MQSTGRTRQANSAGVSPCLRPDFCAPQNSRVPDCPPQLPPRPCDTPSTMSRSSSMSSIAFPEVPNNPLPTKEELVDVSDQYKPSIRYPSKSGPNPFFLNFKSGFALIPTENSF